MVPSLEQVEAEICRRSLWAFVQKAFQILHAGRELDANWHLELICEYLQEVAAGKIRRLIINVPPRSLKSFIVSICFPAWVWKHDGSMKFICGSYSERLGSQHSRYCRVLVLSDWYQNVFRGAQLLRGQNEALKFVTTELGHRVVSGVGGTTLGEGCDILIVDDPHSPAQALSNAERTFANTVWHDQTLTSRFNDQKTGREVVVMQRLHLEDLTGHLLAKGGDWVHLKIPTRAKSREVWEFPVSGKVVTREPGELLHPSRFGEKEDAEARLNLGPYGYAAQHDQEPVPPGGHVIKLDWFPRYSSLPQPFQEMVISIDTGIQPSASSNPTCMSVFGRVGDRWYLAEIVMKTMDFVEMLKVVHELMEKYRSDSKLLLIEDKASGSALIQMLKRTTSYRIETCNPRRPKVERVEEGIGQLANGIVALPLAASSCIVEAERHLMSFPNPPLWDFLDTLSQFLYFLRSRVSRPRVFAL